jgi:hypothetical protein
MELSFQLLGKKINQLQTKGRRILPVKIGREALSVVGYPQFKPCCIRGL